jgi:GAF domain-containing protein
MPIWKPLRRPCSKVPQTWRTKSALQTSALEERARQLETLYLVSAAASRELDLEKVLASTLPLIVDVVGAAGAEVLLVDDDGCLTWAASHSLADSFVAGSLAQRVQPREGLLGGH